MAFIQIFFRTSISHGPFQFRISGTNLILVSSVIRANEFSLSALSASAGFDLFRTNGVSLAANGHVQIRSGPTGVGTTQNVVELPVSETQDQHVLTVAYRNETLTQRFDGASLYSGQHPAISNWQGIRGLSTGVTTARGTIGFHEFQLWFGAMSDADIAQIEADLKAKWGTP